MTTHTQKENNHDLQLKKTPKILSSISSLLFKLIQTSIRNGRQQIATFPDIIILFFTHGVLYFSMKFDAFFFLFSSKHIVQKTEARYNWHVIALLVSTL